jgi:hypothetical protein
MRSACALENSQQRVILRLGTMTWCYNEEYVRCAGHEKRSVKLVTGGILAHDFDDDAELIQYLPLEPAMRRFKVAMSMEGRWHSVGIQMQLVSLECMQRPFFSQAARRAVL